jgi:calcineurin-like phosphoesterase family protein
LRRLTNVPRMKTSMRSLRFSCTVLGAALVAGAPAHAQQGTPFNPHSNNVLTVAVYGDSPYGTSPTDRTETDLTAAFIASINADPKVDLVLHVGDIHSGSQFCTAAYDQEIFDLWTAYKNPLIYTPGDNEWTDCHKTKEGGHVVANGNPVDYAAGDPLANLALIRSLFFADPGYALGGRHKRVFSQSEVFNEASPNDVKYVENVMWDQSKVLFLTLNIPGGSNNDADPWFGQPITQAQTDEMTQRTQADLHWLDLAFAQAEHDGVEAIVISSQADMWDRDGNALSHIANYEPFIASIAAHTLAFGKPVLLFEGDSHHYRSDNPLQSGQPCVFESGVGTGVVDCKSIAESATFTQDAWNNHPSYNVSNFHRVVVHGSTTPLEWVRLTITPGATTPTTATTFGPFSWQRIRPPLM